MGKCFVYTIQALEGTKVRTREKQSHNYLEVSNLAMQNLPLKSCSACLLSDCLKDKTERKIHLSCVNLDLILDVT